jgi:uncharacterized membrane protein YqiK
MREIAGKMNLEEMVSDRQKFANLVKENAEPRQRGLRRRKVSSKRPRP